MTELEALLMGLLQGLTEYLPVSSSGHLTIASHFFGVEAEENLTFTIAVHVATVLSTLVILWKEVSWIFCGLLQTPAPAKKGKENFLARLNEQQRYALNILVSMIPVGIVGVFFKDYVEAIFGSGLLVVGCCLLVTALLLSFSYYYKPRVREEITMRDAFIIGLSQAVAVLPGLSRSGTTIATGLLIGNSKAKLAQFSFLMVIPPILGEALLSLVKAVSEGAEVALNGISLSALTIGFLASFISGCIACKWMINVVKKGKLVYFAIYCGIVGIIVVAHSFFG